MKIWLIIAAGLIILGCLLFVIVMTVNHWDFSKLGTVKHVSNEYTVTDLFSGIEINMKTADVSVSTSDDGTCKVVCYEEEKVRHSVFVRDGVLHVDVNDERKWYEYIGIGMAMPKISVYLPENVYGALVIKGSTGDISISENFTFDSIDLEMSTGDIDCVASAKDFLKIDVTTGDVRLHRTSAGSLSVSGSTGDFIVENLVCDGDIQIERTTGDVILSDIICQRLTLKGSTGKTKLDSVIAKGTISATVTTGDIAFSLCDADEVYIRSGTGDVTGSFLSGKDFIVNTNTGSKEIPSGVTGGRCEITTNTGNVKIEIKE